MLIAGCEPEFIRRVREATDGSMLAFFKTIAEKVELSIPRYGGHRWSKGKRELVGSCPFHDEKSKSFVVSERGFYHCFGCGAHGNAISFIGRTENLDYKPAAEKFLARDDLWQPVPGITAEFVRQLNERK